MIFLILRSEFYGQKWLIEPKNTWFLRSVYIKLNENKIRLNENREVGFSEETTATERFDVCFKSNGSNKGD